MSGSLLVAIFGSIAAGIVAAVGGLFLRLRTLEARRAAADVRLEALEERDTGLGELQGMREELHKMRLCMAESYLRREDFVPVSSRVLGALERQGLAIARLEARLDARTGGRRDA